MAMLEPLMGLELRPPRPSVLQNLLAVIADTDFGDSGGPIVVSGPSLAAIAAGCEMLLASSGVLASDALTSAVPVCYFADACVSRSFRRIAVDDATAVRSAGQLLQFAECTLSTV
jgi:hypothetical protein